MDRRRHGDTKVSFWLPRMLWKRAKLRAASEGRPLRLLIAEALTAYLNRREDA
jgi:hypothetical protein